MAIRPDNDPKSASPRSGAPKGELEQYGVWVKAEPQDVIEEVAAPASEEFDLGPSLDSSSMPEESFLSEDEEKLLGSFDSEFESAEESPPSLMGAQEDTGPLPDIEDMPALEESMLSAEPAPALDEIEGIQIEDIGSETRGRRREPEEQTSQAMGDVSSIEDVSSEFLDLAEEPGQAEAGLQGSGAGLDDVTAEFLGDEDSIELPKTTPATSDFEPLDIDLHFDDSSATIDVGSERGSQSEDAGFEAVTEFDDFLSTDAEASSSPARVPGFDDISAVEAELSSPEPSFRSAKPASQSAASRQAGAGDLSTEILLKIADELSSIRGELISLKSKIGEAMAPGDRAAAKPSKADEALAEGAEEGPSGGFFDEEEDETIALTGDELDNILNTADFTEETAEAEEVLDLEGGLTAPESVDLLDETLLPESGDYSSAQSAASEPAIEEVRLGEAESVEEILPEPLSDELDGLSLMAEAGVEPMTPAPEDTSYLEGHEGLDLGGPIADEPLVEPDLSDFDLEVEEAEPRLEIDEELPLASQEPQLDEEVDLLTEPLEEELTLGMQAGPGYSSEEMIPEAEMLEPVPEIEEPNFAEINLHEEGLEPLSSEPAELEEIEFLPDADLGAASTVEYSPTPSKAQKLEEDEDLVLSPVEEAPAPLPRKEAPRSASRDKEASPAPAAKQAPVQEAAAQNDGDRLKTEIRSVLSYLDKLLDSLPEEKIEEFARSEYFDTYKKLFEELGLV
jgi:pilus assembly protein FimV